MADFSRYSNYNEETGFTSVVFGANAPVLEVELNEMQQILNRKLELFFRYWGNKVLPLSEDIGGISDNVFTLKNCAVLCDGAIIYVKESTVEIGDVTFGFIYAKVEEETVIGYNSTLTSCGDVNGAVIENPIVDNRNPIETTKRKVIKFALVFSEVELQDTETYKYVKVSTLTQNTETGELTTQVEVSTPVTSADLVNYQKIAPTGTEESLLANAVMEPKVTE